jgi:DNA-binding CsgD family transcriptional regulator
LNALLRQVSGGGAGGKLLVRPEKEGGLVAITVMPLPANFTIRFDIGRQKNDALTLILLRQQNANQLLPNELMSLFGLTAAEAEVGLALATGASPEEVAQARGRSVYTLRAQIRTLLEKTDSSSLRELTNKVSSLNYLT